jgi:hypothetical protein
VEDFSLGPLHFFFIPLKSHFVPCNHVKFEQKNSAFTNPSNQWGKNVSKGVKRNANGLKRNLQISEDDGLKIVEWKPNP